MAPRDTQRHFRGVNTNSDYRSILDCARPLELPLLSVVSYGGVVIRGEDVDWISSCSSCCSNVSAIHVSRRCVAASRRSEVSEFATAAFAACS